MQRHRLFFISGYGCFFFFRSPGGACPRIVNQKPPMSSDCPDLAIRTSEISTHRRWQ